LVALGTLLIVDNWAYTPSSEVACTAVVYNADGSTFGMYLPVLMIPHKVLFSNPIFTPSLMIITLPKFFNLALQLFY
jgi:hypothetical protein